jgi:hypothetical protein
MKKEGSMGCMYKQALCYGMLFKVLPRGNDETSGTSRSSLPCTVWPRPGFKGHP